MKKLAVISGKGGTGKTMMTGALATLASGRIALADCDVDAANLEILLSPEMISSEPYYGQKVSFIDNDLCIWCGSCKDSCRFDAIVYENDRFRVNPQKCEGCAVCTIVCPAGATSMISQEKGRIFLSKTSIGLLAHARLNPGSGSSGLLITEVRKLIDRNAGDADLLLIDGPPGIGCPLIATVSGVDAVLVVTEPSRSGLHDLQRVIRVAEDFGVDVYVAINRYDLEEDVSAEITDYCTEIGVKIVGRIPFDSNVIRAVRNMEPVTVYDTPAASAIKELWNIISTDMGII